MTTSLELRIEDESVSSGTVALSWVVPSRLARAIRKTGEDAYLLIAACTPTEEVSRKLVRLADGMAFLYLSKPGRNFICASIVTGRLNTLKDAWLSRSGRDWNQSFINADRTGFLGGVHFSEVVSHDILPVTMPAEVFAPEPPAWEQAWVNRLFGSSPADQCGYRRRQIFAYLVQPFLWLAMAALRLTVLVAGVLGFAARPSRLAFNDVLHPDFNEIFKGLYLEPNKESPWMATLMTARIGLSPGMLLLIGGLIYYISETKSRHPLFAHSLGYSFLSIVALILVINGSDRAQQRKKQGKPTRIRKVPRRPAEDLTCLAFQASSLRPRRSLRLRYGAIKAAMCRPFAR